MHRLVRAGFSLDVSQVHVHVMSAQGVVNLCFHGIGEPQRELEPGEAPYWVTEERFVEILEVLEGRDGISVSFDDGNASDTEIALEELAARGLRADFFVVAARLDTPGSLSSTQLRELVDAGMGVGSHGMDHRPWPGLDRDGLRRELTEARERIERIVGEPVDRAACPLGRYDRSTLRELRRCGYRRVYTSDRATTDAGSWLQPRFSVRANDTAESVESLLTARISLTRRLALRTRLLAKRLR